MLNQKLTSFNHVVAIGGGHGLGTILASLSSLGPRLTGIVATTDNGGSTGRLRQDQQTIAWGDLRNCLSHLAHRPSLGSMLFDHRFTGNNELSGHNLGNVVLHALDQLCVRPLEAINLIRGLLKIETSIIPMSEASTHLVALSHCGNKVFGELNVDGMKEAPIALTLEPEVQATSEACAAIEQAQLIILGPGSFLTSIMPPLLLPEIANSIRKANAHVVLIDNLTAEYSPASTFSIEDKIVWFNQVIGKNVIADVIQHGTTPQLASHYSHEVRFNQFPLMSDHHPGLHDKQALADAIEEVCHFRLAQLHLLRCS
ncbi:uridine diphosphate-N-acetylglucosamine-binding protein YvcK [Shewanella saliphila]|uniref:Putative gluconeogenesis factor n=1 Tax=Shewanella saliphila TaxID=2282698 RepID=A0ABQ2QAF8_9GAMM|nr:uridine diphosphate-N-acetylglucosamine-binding protein YvcK [Shewanella saliphila]MCL1100814.1 uridine diphosphate-N-acetylglucosamine-binding protein YvcK [Shewanella saliphila]GGP60874.1 putative gluconeogenesis factor [Shewanella saliphila]